MSRLVYQVKGRCCCRAEPKSDPLHLPWPLHPLPPSPDHKSSTGRTVTFEMSRYCMSIWMTCSWIKMNQDESAWTIANMMKFSMFQHEPLCFRRHRKRLEGFGKDVPSGDAKAAAASQSCPTWPRRGTRPCHVRKRPARPWTIASSFWRTRIGLLERWQWRPWPRRSTTFHTGDPAMAIGFSTGDPRSLRKVTRRACPCCTPLWRSTWNRTPRMWRDL